MFLPIQRSLRVAAMVVLALVFTATLPAHAQDQRCFSETNQCISGRFRQHWEQNGGLAVFGFPLTPAREERNRDTGQTYLTQWFERNRFELHPENPAPYDVLLGRLGDDRLVQLDRDWRNEGRETSGRVGCRWFAETSHNVCDQEQGVGFKSYWEEHGLAQGAPGPRLNAYERSLALFGLPLMVPRMETNSSGDMVLTQWFERARFEWHPNNPTQFKVLLGRLGDEVMRVLPGERRPTGRLVYVSSQGNATGGDLYTMAADGTGQTRITYSESMSLEKAEYAVSPLGNRIAYRVGGTLNVIDINGTGNQVVATTELREPDPFEVFAPTWAPDGSYLAYVLQGDIYASRLDGSPPARITQIGRIPSPSCLSWARNGYLSFRIPGGRAYDLFVVRSDGSDLRQLAYGLCGTLSPSGDRMVFMYGDLSVVNLDGTNMRSLTGGSGKFFLPGIWSPDEKQILAVGYSPDNPDNTDIFVIDVASGQLRQLTTDPNRDSMPSWSPDGKFITFASKRTQRYGIYVMAADGTGQTLLETPEESAAPRWVTR